MKHNFYPSCLFLIILFALSCSLKAQSVQNQPPKNELPNPFQVVKKYVEQNNYITPIFELKNREDEPVLIQALYASESADAVPVDQIILYPQQQIPVLMLPKGMMRIRAIGKSGTMIAQYSFKAG